MGLAYLQVLIVYNVWVDINLQDHWSSYIRPEFYFVAILGENGGSYIEFN